LLEIPDLEEAEPLFKNHRNLPAIAASASSQFSRAGLEALKADVESLSPGARLIVVDLRQESHGFDASGRPISWKPKEGHNWANQGRSATAIEDDQARRLAAIGGTSEADACRELGIGYQRFYVTDHLRPDNPTVGEMAKFLAGLEGQNVWLHVHCRAGKGRTTTFLVLDELLRSRGRKSLEAIVAGQVAEGGVDLLVDRPGSDYTAGFHKDRRALLQAFEAYARATAGLVPWEAWRIHAQRKGDGPRMPWLSSKVR
jgi:hypothetical protein